FRGLHRLASKQGRQSRPGYVDNITPEIDDRSNERAPLDDRGKGRAGVGPAEQARDDLNVRRAADGDVFGKALDDSDGKRLEGILTVLVPPKCKVYSYRRSYRHSLAPGPKETRRRPGFRRRSQSY